VSEEVVIDRGGLTVIVSEAMSTAAVGVWESVTGTLKVVEPRVVPVPLVTPPVLMVRQEATCPMQAPSGSALTPGRGQPGGIRNIDYGGRKGG
jgi:hypothetical protein